MVIMAARKSLQPEAAGTSLDYDPQRPKRYSPKNVQQLFDIAFARDRDKRLIAADLKPHVGLWLHIEGHIESIENEAGDDGNGGQWASATVDYAKRLKKRRVLDMPRVVEMFFLGDDANLVRALSIGDPIRANGRIESITGFLGGIRLVPTELLEAGPEVSLPSLTEDTASPQS